MIIGYLQDSYLITAYAASASVEARGLQFLVPLKKDNSIQFMASNTGGSKSSGNEFMKTTIPSYQGSKGYLETTYLVGSYLETVYDPFVIRKVPSFEFLVVNTKDKKQGLQFFTRQDRSLNTNSEFLAQIKKDKNNGVEFYVINTKQKNRQAQFFAKISKDKKQSIQFSGFNTKQENHGVQFTGQISKLKNRQAQFFAKISKDKKQSIQFSGFNTKEENHGVQFISFRIAKNGLQFRSVIYNTTQLRFLADFVSRGLTGNNWTATSTAPSASGSFAVKNLNTDIVEQVWRSTSLVTQTLVCDTENTSGEYVDTLAILNHNLTQGATVFFQGSNDANFANLGVSVLLENNVKNSFWVSPQIPLYPYRYWRLEIYDPANPDGFIQIGSVVFGAASIFSQEENFTDEVNFGFKQFQDKIFTEGHTNVSNDRGQKKYLEMSFNKLRAEGANFKSLRRAYLQFGTLLKVLYVPIPQDPAAFSIFAKMSEIPSENHIYTGGHYVSLEIKLDESL